MKSAVNKNEDKRITSMAGGKKMARRANRHEGSEEHQRQHTRACACVENAHTSDDCDIAKSGSYDDELRERAVKERWREEGREAEERRC